MGAPATRRPRTRRCRGRTPPAAADTGPGPGRPLDHLLDVALQVAHRGVDLAERDADHDTSLEGGGAGPKPRPTFTRQPCRYSCPSNGGAASTVRIIENRVWACSSGPAKASPVAE